MKKKVPSHLLPYKARRQARRTRVVALGAVLAGSLSGRPALAQQTPTAPAGPVSQSARETFYFDLPEGPIDAVLAGFEKVTGIRATLVSDGIGQVMSPGVKGTMTAAQAMAGLLEGTSLQSRFDADAVHISLASVTESVDVVGRAPFVSSPRYTVPLGDVAQTVALVARAGLEQQAAM